MADIDQKYSEMVVAEKPKQKRKKLTAEEQLVALQAKIEAVAERARQRTIDAQKARNKKKTDERAKLVTAKQGLRNQLIARIKERAEQNDIDFKNEDIKVPEKLPKVEHLNKYYAAAKKRYYTRRKDKPTSAQRIAMAIAQEEGIPLEYFKNTRSKKTSDNVLAAVRKKYKNATEKKKRHDIRPAIIAQLMEQYDLKDEDAVLKIVCVRKKKNAVKPENKK